MPGDWFKRQQRLWIFAAGQVPWSFDAVEREGHLSKMNITKNPVENGVQIADHAYPDPYQLELSVRVSDFLVKKLDTDPFASDAGRSVNAYQQLLNLQAQVEPFSVQTGLILVKDLVITSIATEQDSRTATVLDARVSLEQVNRQSTQTVDFPPRAAKKPTRQASQTVSKGQVKSTEATAQQRDSWAFQIFGGQ